MFPDEFVRMIKGELVAQADIVELTDNVPYHEDDKDYAAYRLAQRMLDNRDDGNTPDFETCELDLGFYDGRYEVN